MKHRLPDCSPGLGCRRRAAGFTLLEMMVAMIMLGSLMATVVPLLSWVNVQRRAADARQVAVQEATNVLERFTAREWDEVTQEAADAVKLSADAAATLREARLQVTVHADQKQPLAKRITVLLRWKNRVGEDLSPVRLTSFVYRRSETP
ncbi:MAG: type II secretion system protein [Planctomycetes bacterium]|nr:type II secretion system protein [Planctomycetota bacterium]